MAGALECARALGDPARLGRVEGAAMARQAAIGPSHPMSASAAARLGHPGPFAALARQAAAQAAYVREEGETPGRGKRRRRGVG